jgi:hypothetical protein
VDVTRHAADLLAAGARSVLVIADREADLYETFACLPEGVDVLVRAHHNRKMADRSWLFDACANQPELGRETVALPAAPGRKSRKAHNGRKARKASVALRACRVDIPRPKRNHPDQAAVLPASVALTLLDAREVDPPAGETALHWRLLTTRAVEDLAGAQKIVAFYRGRWDIEQVFRVMKTRGFDIEAVPIQDDMPLKNLACATLIAAIQIQQMLHDRDGQAGRPMTDMFDAADQPVIETIGKTLEGRTQRQRNPHPPGSLAHATWVCARLGGWNGYYGKPGPIVLVKGHVRLMTMLEGIKRFRLG